MKRARKATLEAAQSMTDEAIASGRQRCPTCEGKGLLGWRAQPHVCQPCGGAGFLMGTDTSKPLSADEKAWAAYLETPAEQRLVTSWDDLSQRGREIWRGIARKRWAAGWRPSPEGNHSEPRP
jgi:hypothetical protein